MKKIVLAIISFYMFSCENSQEFSQATVEGLSELPASATKEPYESNPELVKVTLNENGVKSIGDYLSGKKSGNWTEFHSNGLIKSVTGYINGVKQGGYSEIDDRGQLQVSAFYHNGELHGEWKKFNRNKVKEERTYINGKLENMIKIYYDNGNIMEEGSYANGVRDGLSKWYDQEGNVTIEYEYKAGELVNK